MERLEGVEEGRERPSVGVHIPDVTNIDSDRIPERNPHCGWSQYLSRLSANHSTYRSSESRVGPGGTGPRASAPQI